MKRGLDSQAQRLPKAVGAQETKIHTALANSRPLWLWNRQQIRLRVSWWVKRMEQVHGVSLIRTYILSQNHIHGSASPHPGAWVECRGIWWQTGSPYCTSAEIPEPDSIQERCHRWPGPAYLCACSPRNKDVNKHCYPHWSSTVISIRQSRHRKLRPLFFAATPLPLTPAARARGDFLY